MVLYNGGKQWEAPTDIHELIALSPGSVLWPWQPQARYYLVDMGAFPKARLARCTGAAALLFRLERQPSIGELDTLISEVIGWLHEHPDCEELRPLFTELVREAYTGLAVAGPIPEDLLEMKTNLSKLGKTWMEQWRAEGLAEGKAEGLAEGKAEGLAEGKAEGLAEGEAKGLVRGKAEGKAEALVCLLGGRFGALASSFHGRIREAKLATLECWFKRAIVAPDLASVFEPAVLTEVDLAEA